MNMSSFTSVLHPICILPTTLIMSCIAQILYLQFGTVQVIVDHQIYGRQTIAQENEVD